MHLYNLTLQKATAITQAVPGSFSAPKVQEIIVARGKIIELLREEGGRLQSILSHEVFGVIRSIASFRLTGGNRDYIVVGSDSGRIVILEYNAEKNAFVKIHQETYGKTGCRRIVPGQYVSVDPKGRAVMIGAVEKQKFVYVLNRDSANRLTISSPLEAHKSHTVIYSMVAVDVGFENPKFACIELDHTDADASPEGIEGVQKMLTLYELDLGLNHVVKKWSGEIDRSSHYLVAVPGGNDGPGGVLVCSFNYISYRNQAIEVRAPIPRRHDMNAERGLMIVSHSMHKKKDLFFFFLQSECGDVYKVTLDYNRESDTVNTVNIKYFDTVPVASSIVVLRSGFLFVAAEFGNHKLYQFKSIGDDDDENIVGYMEIEADKEPIPLFKPRLLKNLQVVDEMASLSPIIDFKIMDVMNEGTPQIVCACGRGANSALRILRHGLAVSQLAASELPSLASAVWSVKLNQSDDYDKYIIVSLPTSTLVLAIGTTVEEVHNSGFIANTQTLLVSMIGDDGLLQIYPHGIRHIRSDGRINDWKTPGKRSIAKGTANESQVAIALNGGEIIYFELDQQGVLRELEKKDMGQDITCIDIGPVPAGRQRCKFLAVGFPDKSIRVLSVDPDECLNVLSRQALLAEPESLAIVEMQAPGQHVDLTSFYLNVGLNNGILVRNVIDSVTGELSDTRSRLLGVKPVKLIKIKVQESNALLALSSRSWLWYNYQAHFQMTPLSIDPFTYASNFSSEQCPEGIVAISGNVLKVLSLERLGEVFNQTTIPLSYTPRKFIVHPNNRRLIILETDHNAYNDTEKQQLRQRLRELRKQQEAELREQERQERGMDVDDTQPPAPAEEEEEVVLPEAEYGAPKPKPESGKWASYIRVFDPTNNATTDFIELPDNEAAFSLCTVQFQGSNEHYLVVGTAKDMTLYPRTVAAGFMHVYRFIENGNKLQLVHKTQVDDIPLALHAFQGRLLAGIGSMLRIYDLGKRKLLRKCENKNFPNFIVSLTVQESRIYVGDVTESIHFVKYRRSDNTLNIFADNTTPRWLTASTLLDYNTLAGADKFGNIFVSRLPTDVSEEDDDPTGASSSGFAGAAGRWVWERGLLNGAPNKAQEIVQFHVGETVTGLSKANLVPGGPGALVYTTVMGSIGILIPFQSKSDLEFFTLLEMHMRQEFPPLCGREHLGFRSYYFPVKNVIDGDLCEQFAMLDANKQRSIAQEMERMPNDVSRKLEDIRNQGAF